MAEQYASYVVTNAGRDIIARITAGLTVNFSRIVIGSGSDYDTENFVNKTELINEVKSLGISSIQITDSNIVELAAEFAKSDIEDSFWFREIGIYVIDPNDETKEILFAYGNRNDAAEYITPHIQNYAVLKKIKCLVSVGTAANVNIQISIENGGSNGGGTEIGEPRVALNNVLPKNCIWLEGATVYRVYYAKLFEVYGTAFGEGDGETTFTLPDFRDRVIWGVSQFSDERYREAALPNITGFAATSPWKADNMWSRYPNKNGTAGPTGAFYSAGYARTGSDDGREGAAAAFDASRSSDVYKNDCKTVQPPAIEGRIYTRYK